MKRILTTVTLMAMVVCFISGCGEQPVPESANNISSIQAGSDKILTIFAHKPDTLCPLLTENESNLQMLQMVFDSLVGLQENLSPEPCLASEWSVSEDGKTWTFKLREDVKWHDGSQFDANDVVYTVKQIQNNEDSVFFNNVANITDVKANGNYTVEFQLDSPRVNFVNLLYFPIIKNGDAEPDKDSFYPVGTGPYVFNNNKDDSEYKLIRNESWWGGKATAEGVVVKLLADTETALYAFGAGEIDLITTNSADWGKYVNAETSSYKSLIGQELTYVGINHNKGSLKYSEVRRAFSYAINRQQLVEEIMLNNAVATATPANPHWTISQNVEFELKQNEDTAKTEFEVNGWEKADGYWHKTVDDEYCTTTYGLLYNDDNPEREAIAQLVEKNLESAGIDITLEKVTYDEYVNRIYSGEYDLFIGSVVISADLDFSFFMNEGNIFGFANQEMTELRDQIRIGDPTDQATLYAPLIEKFYVENPVVSLFFKNPAMLYSKSIEGEFKSMFFDVYRGIEGIHKKEVK